MCDDAAVRKDSELISAVAAAIDEDEACKQEPCDQSDTDDINAPEEVRLCLMY